ncbi:MAG TPA: class I SAM-dependent methyltransferase [Solirubrobacteraceae bacterium]|nr:class I SAM-dependent methyltransferase [Solirubrobacteraceae bacterium]
MSPSETISPTAHYTGYVWARNGLSNREFETIEGRVLFEALQPAMRVNSVLGRGTLESYLLARHRAIDGALERAIEEHGITQVIEVAAGLSPRGWRFHQRYGERITYIEADLAGMAERKRRALERLGSLSEHHQVRVLDALKGSGAQSLPAVAGELEPEHGLAIITEGLLGYLPTDSVLEIWARFAGVLGGFASGRYVSDIHIGAVQDTTIRAFRLLLSIFVRGRVHLHFQSPGEVADALTEAGFKAAEVRLAAEPAGARESNYASRLAHILEAWTT